MLFFYFSGLITSANNSNQTIEDNGSMLHFIVYDLQVLLIVELNPAMSGGKGPTNFVCYGGISVALGSIKPGCNFAVFLVLIDHNGIFICFLLFGDF